MKTIAVIFGGRSTEHDVSIVTAIAAIIKPLELAGDWRVVPVYIAKDGSWYSDKKLKKIELFRTGQIDDFMAKAPKVQLLFDDGLVLIKDGRWASKGRKIDMVFPAMHGTHGEDGELMGLLEMANAPYVGCDFRSSAVAMDKVLSKQVAEDSGLASSPWAWFYAADLKSKKADILKQIDQLKYPLFVKPAHLGSSIGISKVTAKKDLMNALEVAVHYDDKVIVEQGVKNLIEVTLPIMGNDQPVPALLERPLTQPKDFFDFDTKYIRDGQKSAGKKGGTKGAQGYSQLPAELPRSLYQKAEATGLAVYKALGCSGIARVDMLIDSKTKKVYFNEVNPMPGSLYAHNWRAAGVSSVELISKLVDYAQERWQSKQKLTTSFSTNFLKQF